MTDSPENGSRETPRDGRVSSLADLPRSIPPPRDLWADISAQLQESTDPERSPKAPDRHHAATNGAWRAAPWLAALAAGLAVAVTLWIVRSPPPEGAALVTATVEAQNGRGGGVSSMGEAPHGDYLHDAAYQRQRAELLQLLPAKLASLPPETQVQVQASLSAIHQAMSDLEAALGRYSTNALLQELLINTCQDEMRLLMAVNEASGIGATGNNRGT